jgi:hypothetical protein
MLGDTLTLIASLASSGVHEMLGDLAFSNKLLTLSMMCNKNGD